MKTRHLFENGYYFIGNKSVAKSFMFQDERDCSRFRSRMSIELLKVCDILAFGLKFDEFQMVIKMKSRPEIEEYYISKYGEDGNSGIIPETTYIFAQLMANLQSGYVKYFNYRYGRDGGLMCRRYHRELIESPHQLEKLISEVHSLEMIWKRSAIWTFRRKEAGFRILREKEDGVMSSKLDYESGKRIENGFLTIVNISDVRGHFSILPPKQLKTKNREQKLKNLVDFMLLKSKFL